jgi:hypothetical protein
VIIEPARRKPAHSGSMITSAAGRGRKQGTVSPGRPNNTRFRSADVSTAVGAREEIQEGRIVSVQIAEATIRPAAVLPVDAAARILSALQDRDVAKGGVWNATPGVWQRYDKPWNGPRGSRGTAELVGTIAVVYDRPRRHEITVYKATLTQAGKDAHWTTDALCDDALSYAALTLASCPRDSLGELPPPDPFREDELPDIPRQRSLSELLNTDVRELLKIRR